MTTENTVIDPAVVVRPSKREPTVALPIPNGARVRYSRDNWTNSPKDTLVTIEQNGIVFFGIARCNTTADRAFKKVGRNMAITRALEAKAWHENMDTSSAFHLNSDGLTGYCDLCSVKLLLTYFKDIGELGNRRKH